MINRAFLTAICFLLASTVPNLAYAQEHGEREDGHDRGEREDGRERGDREDARERTEREDAREDERNRADVERVHDERDDDRLAADQGYRDNEDGTEERRDASTVPTLPGDEDDRGRPDPDTAVPNRFGMRDAGVTRYSDGSYDHLRIDTRGGTYSIERYDRSGRLVGNEHGSLPGYIDSGPPRLIAPPPPLRYGYRCLTRIGPVTIRQVMEVGQPCIVDTAYGRFTGVAVQ